MEKLEGLEHVSLSLQGFARNLTEKAQDKLIHLFTDKNWTINF